MKKFLLFPLMVFMTVFIAPSCSGDDDEIFPPAGGDSTEVNDTITTGDTIITNATNDSLRSNVPIKFEGGVIVNGDFTQENIVCEATFDKTYKKVTININDVKFAENMPVKVNMTLNDITCNKLNKNSFEFSGENIVPTMGVAPVPTYTFTAIEGRVKYHLLDFSATLNMGTIVFRGKRVLQ